MIGSSAIDIVEAAYRPSDGREEWLRGIASAAAASPSLNGGFGVFAFEVVIEDNRPHITPPLVHVGGGSREHARILEDIHDTAPTETIAATYGAGRSWVVLRDTLGGEQFDREPWLAAARAAHVRDGTAIIAFGTNGRACVIGALQRRAVRRPTPAEQDQLDRVAVHLTAAQRLYYQAAPIEAILETDGRCAHAEGLAKSRPAREALREAARRMDRARAGMRRNDAARALELWQGLVTGRWSLVDRFESDGRRYLVARLNAPELCDPRRLTPRERQVVREAALGRSNKLIAYSLGLGASTVRTHLARAMRKLGIRHRQELLVQVPPEAAMGANDAPEEGSHP
ncbi:MAG: helix-turn-helix transcriptional regulator [Myxococcota bacterium]